MSKLLITHPGKFGDLLWALPTVRAISERLGEKADLALPAQYEGIAELLILQPYIDRVMGMDREHWPVRDTAPITPRIPVHASTVYAAAGWERVFHLGYPAWPDTTLARYTHDLVQTEIELNPHDLERPWITAPTPDEAGDDVETWNDGNPGFGEVSVGFTDEWVELKVGLVHSVAQQHFGGRYSARDFELLCSRGSRWYTEFHLEDLANVHNQEGGWVWAAYVVANTQVFLGCLSALAVLAKAMGKPRVLVEPNPHRHHYIFQHPDQGLVIGSDGKPTFDARHVGEALHRKLEEVRRA